MVNSGYGALGRAQTDIDPLRLQHRARTATEHKSLCQPGSTNPATPCAEEARQRWLIAFEVQCTRLQGCDMMQIEQRQFLVHDALEQRVELQALPSISRTARGRDQRIGIRVLRRFLKKNILIQDVGTGVIKMSYLGNTGCRSNRASTACIAALPSVRPFW